MFLRKKKHNTLPDKVIAENIQKSEEQLEDSRKGLIQARETVSVLNEIRKQNHIVVDLREVFSGR